MATNITRCYVKDNKNLYNLIAWIVNPNSSCDDDGFVKLSKVKTIKVKKICDDIESLVPNSIPSLSQVLLSLNVYRKTGLSNLVDDLLKTNWQNGQKISPVSYQLTLKKVR